MKVGQYIYAKLSATSAVTALVGTRIHPVYLPQNAAYPAVVYMVDNVPHSLTKTQASDLDRSTVRFHIWAEAAQGQDAYAAVENIDAAIRTALDYVSGTAGSVTVESCHYDGSNDGRNEEMTLFLREATYTFITKN
jgi:alanine dehydrogenase